MIGLLHIFVSSKVGFARRDREGLLIFKAPDLESDSKKGSKRQRQAFSTLCFATRPLFGALKRG